MRTTVYDPSARLVTCEHEGCNEQVSVGDSFSFHVVFATTGPAHIPAFGCPAEQHFACCAEHAAACAHRCIDEHMVPAHAAQVGGSI